MTSVALKTEERLLVGKQVGEHGAVCIVTGSTVVGQVGMLKGERADELSMTVDTKAFHIHGLDIELISRAVRVVAICAKHYAVRYRVPG